MKGNKPATTLKRGRKIVGKNREDIRVFEVIAHGKHVGYLYSIPSKSWRARGLGQFHDVTATAPPSKNQSMEDLQRRALERLEEGLTAKGAI